MRRHIVVAGSALAIGLGVLFLTLRTEPTTSATDRKADATHVAVVDRNAAKPLASRSASELMGTARSQDVSAEAPTGRETPVLAGADHIKLNPAVVDIGQGIRRLDAMYGKQTKEEVMAFKREQAALRQHPDAVRGTTRMRENLAAASCKGPGAQAHYNQLPAKSREEMRALCAKHGVTLAEPPPTN